MTRPQPAAAQTRPKPFSKYSAKHTTTPLCVTTPTAEHFFMSVNNAERYKNKNGGRLFTVDRETGQWKEV